MRTLNDCALSALAESGRGGGHLNTVTNRIRIRHLGGLIPLLIGLGLLIYSYTLSLGELTNPGPGLWPFIASFVIVLSSIAILATENDSEDYEAFTSGIKAVGLGLLSLCLFIPLFAYLGFIIPAFLLLTFWLRVLGNESWSLTLLVSVVCAIGFYALFDLALGVPFPEDLIASMLGL